MVHTCDKNLVNEPYAKVMTKWKMLHVAFQQTKSLHVKLIQQSKSIIDKLFQKNIAEFQVLIKFCRKIKYVMILYYLI